MCRLLAELTHTDTRLMTETIKRLEERSGQPGVDIRTTADIHAQIHLTVRALGLDPRDTHPKELYVALQNLAATHEQFLLKKFQLSKLPSGESLPTHVSYIFDRLRFNRRAWAIRPASLRRILVQQPPKQLVKALGYRTVESMIKREPVDVLFFFALKTESATWQQQCNKALQKLSPMDFEERLLTARSLEAPRYHLLAGRIAAQEHSVVYGVPLVGTVMLLSSQAPTRPGMVLLALTMALKEVTELQYIHSYLKHHQMQADFSHKVLSVLRDRTLATAAIAGQAFDWRLLHRHYGSATSPHGHPELFQPHLQAEDLAYRHAEEILYRAEPALHMWHGVDYVGLQTSAGVISFNLVDVLVNLVNGISLGRQVSGHMRQSIWDELLLRYLRNDSIEQTVLHQLGHVQSVPDMEFV